MEKKNIFMFYPHISERASELVSEIIKGRWVGQGTKVDEFEQQFKSAFNLPHVVSVNCGSAAIRLALAISNIGPNDDVITTPQCCTATNHPILEQFAHPVFADIQYETGNIDPNDIERRITKKTKAIICSHWGGYPCDLDEIHAIAKKHGLIVIEDATEACGAVYKRNFLGSSSDFTAFSFQAIQSLTTGEGGMLAMLKDCDRQSAIRRRWYGIDRFNRTPNGIGYFDFDIFETGYGYHMTNIAAAIGLANLQELDEVKKRRAEIAGKYREELQKIDGIRLFKKHEDREGSNQLFTLHAKKRDDFCAALKSRGVETSIVHLRNDVYTIFGKKRNDLPNLDEFTRTNISIPIHTKLTDEDVDYVVETIKKGW